MILFTISLLLKTDKINLHQIFKIGYLITFDRRHSVLFSLLYAIVVFLSTT